MKMMVPFTFRSYVGVRDELRLHAAKRDRSLNWITNLALKEWLEQNREKLQQDEEAA